MMTNTTSRTLVWLLAAFVVSVAAIAIIGALAFQGGDYDGYGMMGGGWGWGMAFMVVPGIIFVLILVVILGGLDERPSCVYPMYTPPQTPLDILNQRLARGEIGQDEYQRIKNQLVH